MRVRVIAGDGRRTRAPTATVMNRNRRSTRMRVHLLPSQPPSQQQRLQAAQQQECSDHDCSLSSGSGGGGAASSSVAEDGVGMNEPNADKRDKVSFISCARGLPPQDSAAAEDFAFSPPDFAPTFRPTEQEFAAGPLKYIASIRHLAEPFGICKVIPPPVSSVSLSHSRRS